MFPHVFLWGIVCFCVFFKDLLRLETQKMFFHGKHRGQQPWSKDLFHQYGVSIWMLKERLGKNLQDYGRTALKIIGQKKEMLPEKRRSNKMLYVLENFET